MKKIYKPFELRTMNFLWKTVNYADEKLGVAWNGDITLKHDLYLSLTISGSCPFPNHEEGKETFTLTYNTKGVEPYFSTFECLGKCNNPMNMSIYDLIQRIEGCSYGEAVERFADFCGVEVISHVGKY